MVMPKVSVIVPVYNVYDYLDKCLDSLVKQTLKDIEIIVVNDGSPDNSQAIIDKYNSGSNDAEYYFEELQELLKQLEEEQKIEGVLKDKKMRKEKILALKRRFFPFLKK